MKSFARNSNPGNKRLKDSEMKNRKLAEKRQSAPFSDASSEISKDHVDFTPISTISGSISDCDAESVAQGPCLDLFLSTPEKISSVDLSPTSTINNVERHMDISIADRVRLIADLPIAVNSLRVEVNELKKFIYPSDLPEEKNQMEENIRAKYRIVLLAFMLLAVLVLIVVFFSSGKQVPYTGPLPT